MKKMNVFTNNDLNAEVVALFLDKSIISRFKTIQQYLDHEGLKIDDQEHKKLIKYVEKKVYTQVKYYAHLMYHYMTVSGDWGSPGEQQVKITFCRNLLGIEPKAPITAEQVESFDVMVAETIKKLKLDQMSASTAEFELKNYKFKMFGQMFELFKGAQINIFLQFCGSDYFLHCGQYGKQMEFIMGRGNRSVRKGYNVTFVTKEVIRTPNNVMSMAAIIGHQNIYIRLESLKVIFNQKWIQIFDYNEMDMLSIFGSDAWNISEGIKLNVLSLYNINSKEELIQKEDTFLKDMAETILYHEFGHGVIQNDIIPFEFGAIGEGTKIYGENIYTALLEFLADFCPTYNDVKGPIRNMIDISKTDINRAKKMYLMYLSDTWFYNTEDTYMFTYSDMMALILIKYMSRQDNLLVIDFKQMAIDFEYNKDNPSSVFDKIMQLYIQDMTELKDIIVNANFNVSGQSLNYKKIREFLIEEFRKNDGFVHTETYEFMVPFWTNVLGYVQKLSEQNEALNLFLTQRQDKILKKLLVLSCGKSKAMEYEYNCRNYIMDQMKALNILAINENQS